MFETKLGIQTVKWSITSFSLSNISCITDIKKLLFVLTICQKISASISTKIAAFLSVSKDEWMFSLMSTVNTKLSRHKCFQAVQTRKKIYSSGNKFFAVFRLYKYITFI